MTFKYFNKFITPYTYSLYTFTEQYILYYYSFTAILLYHISYRFNLIALHLHCIEQELPVSISSDSSWESYAVEYTQKLFADFLSDSELAPSTSPKSLSLTGVEVRRFHWHSV